MTTVAAIVVMGFVALTPETMPVARANTNACSANCQNAYGQCYKASGSNRKACEAQLQQCLAGCIKTK